MRFTCPEGQYHEYATLMLSPFEDVIRQLFHLRGTWTVSVLLTFIPFSYILGLITYGIAIPGGLFIPNMLTGACFGRLFGELFAVHIFS